MKRHGTKRNYLILKGALIITLTLFSVIPAGAAVVHTDLGSGIFLKNEGYQFDADGDGLGDIQLLNQKYNPTWIESFFTSVEPPRDNNSYIAYSHKDGGYDYAEAFTAGEEIGGNTVWTNANPVDIEYADGSGFVEGDWRHEPDYTAYTGFKFYSTLDDDWHYGWMLLKVDNEDESAITLFGYAWETEANTAILAGDTGSHAPVPAAVWLLGSGLAALGAIRRKGRRG